MQPAFSLISTSWMKSHSSWKGNFPVGLGRHSHNDLRRAEYAPHCLASVTSSHPDLDCVFVNSGMQRRSVFTEPETISIDEIQAEMTVSESNGLQLRWILIPSDSLARSTISLTSHWRKSSCRFSWLKRTHWLRLYCMSLPSSRNPLINSETSKHLIESCPGSDPSLLQLLRFKGRTSPVGLVPTRTAQGHQHQSSWDFSANRTKYALSDGDCFLTQRGTNKANH